MEGSPECASVSEPLRVTTTIKQPHPEGVRGSSALALTVLARNLSILVKLGATGTRGEFSRR